MPGITYIPQGESSFDKALRGVGAIASLINEQQRLKQENQMIASRLATEDLTRQQIKQSMDFQQLYAPRQAEAGIASEEARTQATQAQTRLSDMGYQLQSEELANRPVERQQQADLFQMSKDEHQAQLLQTRAATSVTNFRLGQDVKQADLDDKAQKALEGLPNVMNQMTDEEFKQATGYTDRRFVESFVRATLPKGVQALTGFFHDATEQLRQNDLLRATDQKRTEDQIVAGVLDAKPGTEKILQNLAKGTKFEGMTKDLNFHKGGLDGDQIMMLWNEGTPETKVQIASQLNLKIKDRLPTKQEMAAANARGQLITSVPDLEGLDPLVSALAGTLTKSKTARDSGVKVEGSASGDVGTSTTSSTKPTPDSLKPSGGGKVTPVIKEVQSDDPGLRTEAYMPGEMLPTKKVLTYPGNPIEYQMIMVGDRPIPVPRTQQELDALPPGTVFYDEKLKKARSK